jgi:hypothetical protein
VDNIASPQESRPQVRHHPVRIRLLFKLSGLVYSQCWNEDCYLKADLKWNYFNWKILEHRKNCIKIRTYQIYFSTKLWNKQFKKMSLKSVRLKRPASIIRSGRWAVTLVLNSTSPNYNLCVNRSRQPFEFATVFMFQRDSISIAANMCLYAICSSTGHPAKLSVYNVYSRTRPLFNT